MEINQLVAQASAFIQAGRIKDALSTVNVGLIHYPRHPVLIQLFRQIPEQYDANFYDDAYDVSLASARIILRHLQIHYPFQSVVDVGAGAGAWSHAAIEMGKQVVSIDGEWVRFLEKKCDRLEYQFQNLNETVLCNKSSDLAVCVEVAEHLEPERSRSFVTDLCALAPVVLFSASLPRQGGSGHINCRPHSFWIDQFERNHFTALDVFRPTFWYDGRVGPWYAQNSFLFVANTYKGNLLTLPRPSLVDVYHPRVVVDSPICLKDHMVGEIDPARES